MREKTKHKLVWALWIFIISLLFMPILIREIFQPPTRKQGIEVGVQAALRRSFIAMNKYLDENKEYPSAENWHDLLLPSLYNEKDAFTLPSKVDTKNVIAFNPNARPDSPKDVVLLFESTGGPNAHGQEELLAPTSNGKPGCFIVFNDGQITFISPEQTKNLNWGNN